MADLEDDAIEGRCSVPTSKRSSCLTISTNSWNFAILAGHQETLAVGSAPGVMNAAAELLNNESAGNSTL